MSAATSRRPELDLSKRRRSRLDALAPLQDRCMVESGLAYSRFHMNSWLKAVMSVGLSIQAQSADMMIDGRVYDDPRHPPTFRALTETEAASVSLGQSIFETEWAAAGAPSASGHTGV